VSRRRYIVFDREAFESDKQAEILRAAGDSLLFSKARDFIVHSDLYKYGYYWSWLGLPIIQMPEDIVLTQELLWETKPDFVIEAGIAWGGSLAMYAAFQELQGHGHVFGIDITIPENNRRAIMNTAVSKRITLIEASSSDSETFAKVAGQIPKGSNVLLVLDSNHSHKHVLAELELWTPLLQIGNYVIVSDTIVEFIPEQTHRKRPWGPGDNPMTASMEFLKKNPQFSASNNYSARSIASFNPSGYLKRIN